jgi:tetratricopeptide (TPR) repeat protein
MDIRDLWDFNDPGATEMRFRDVLASTASVEQQIMIKTQIARTLGLQRKFSEALALLDEVDAEIAVNDVSADVRAYAMMERGRVLRSSGDKTGARPLFDAARATATSADVIIDAIHMQAIVAEPDEAITLNLAAIGQARASDDPRARKWLGPLLNNTGWSYHDKGFYELALDLFQEALEFRQQEGDREKIRIAQWSVARCFRSIGRFGPALVMQKALLLGNPNDGYTHEEIAENMAALGQVAEAKPHFARAYELLKDDPWLQDSEPDRLKRLRAMSGL